MRRATASAMILATTLALVLALAIPPAHADLEPIPYVVASGDTASRIAARHGLTLTSLRALNDGVDLERLRVGQSIVIGEGRLVTHRVRPGDTLGALAERYGVRVREIARWNEGVDRLSAGRELRIWARRDEPPSESIGRPDAGSLVHGVVIPRHEGYVVRDPSRAHVTRAVAEELARGFDALRARHPDAPRIEIRDASLREGGRMREHHSHQSGRDVDLVYFRRRCAESLCGRHWMTPDLLDAETQWALLEPWIRAGSVEYVFVDHALQEPLRAAARDAGATRAELAAWFQWPRAPDVRAGLIRHVDRHVEHLHVRFACDPRDRACVPSDGAD